MVQPRSGIDGEIHRSGDEGRAVLAVLQMHRKRREVGIVAGEDNLVRRGLGGRHLDNVGFEPQAAADFGGQLVRRDTEGARDAAAAAGDIADEFMPLRAGGAEPHRFRIVLEHGGDVGEIDRLAAALKFFGRQVFDKAAQAEAIEVRGLRLCCGGRAFDDTHGGGRPV